MDDRELLIISFIISVAGLLGFFVYYTMTSAQEVSLSKLNTGFDGKMVVVKGKIVKIKFHENGHIFITLGNKNDKVIVPIFSEYAEKLDSNCKVRGSFARVEGRVEVYRGNLEVIPERGHIECWK